MALLRAVTGFPIVAGQSECIAETCRDLMVAGAIDVCNLDASGGPTVWLRVARMAQCFGIEMAHHGEPVVGSHLLAAVENGTYGDASRGPRSDLSSNGCWSRRSFGRFLFASGSAGVWHHVRCGFHQVISGELIATARRE
jgi:L-alanine-DL-glutamate epimerase-like enolase superfamily enzyme